MEKTNKEKNRKVFISFLGASNYGACVYSDDTYTSSSVKYIQEAMLDKYNKSGNWTKDDVAYILLTKGAKSKNWVDGGQTDRNTKLPLIDPKTGKPLKGLQSVLTELNPVMPVYPVDLPCDGNSEAEIMDIFSIIFNCINPNDELYFDITHGFRYLPMLVIVLGNYAKILKNAKVKAITYGNFEGRQKDEKDIPFGPAKIVDLIALSNIQDWAIASNAFVKYGNTESLFALGKDSVTPLLSATKGKHKNAAALRDFVTALNRATLDFRTCRGVNIVNGENISALKGAADSMAEELVPLMKPIIAHTKNVFQEFDSQPNYQNGFVAAEWCYKHGMYQQAITILQENIVTYFCMKMGSLDWQKEVDRELVNVALKIAFDPIPEEKWTFGNCKDRDLAIKTVNILSKDEDLKKIAKKFASLRVTRNDLNHSGIRNAPAGATTIAKSIEKSILEIKELLSNK